MAEKKRTIHGFSVVFDDDIEGIKKGLEHLEYDLQYKEAKTLFDAARLTGRAEFEDDEDRDWTLTRKEGHYILSRRQGE